MNETLQKALGELLSKANDGIDAAGNFLSAELPDVIRQLLMWHGVYTFILFIVGVILLMESIYFTIKILKGTKTEGHFAFPTSSYDSTTLFGFLSFMALIVVDVIALAAINLQWIQIWIAPKVWLLEYAAKLAG